MEELRKILLASANRETVVVGGMAVSILAWVYGVDVPEPCTTLDVDFLGDRLAIELSEKRLSDLGFVARKYLATPEDVGTPNSGKLAVDVSADAEPAEIDYLFRIDGLATDEIEEKAVQVEIDGGQIRVMHPLLLLENKINNLALYPNKRDVAGIQQVRLAVGIARRYLEELSGTRAEVGQRQMLTAIERIFRLAQREASCFVYLAHGIDALQAVPLKSIDSREFLDNRWPQIQVRTSDRRTRFKNLWDRMLSMHSDPTRRRFRI